MVAAVDELVADVVVGRELGWRRCARYRPRPLTRPGRLGPLPLIDARDELGGVCKKRVPQQAYGRALTLFCCMGTGSGPSSC